MSNIISQKFVKDGSERALIEAVQEVLDDGALSVLIFSCADNQLDPELIDSYLKQLVVPVFGGIFPQIINEQQNYSEGSLVVGFRKEVDITILENISSLTNSAPEFVKFENNNGRSESYIILLDGLAQGLDTLTDLLYESMGVEANLAGGGAGSLDLVQRPCLFSNRGILMDAALIVNVSHKIGVGVKHGWKPLSGPFLVTESNGNQIHSLNFKPALDVYREAIAPHTVAKLDIDNFFSIAKQFPLGMERLGQEFLVRDPISTDGFALNCVGHVPEQTMLFLLQGENESLINAAGEAANEAIKGNAVDGLIVFDCISRVLYLQNNFRYELEKVASVDMSHPIIGALTLGEISSITSGGIHFHNKTIVIAALVRD